jgi:uncharacterized protein
LNPDKSLRPVDVVRRTIEALNRGEIDAAIESCAEDVVVWAPGPDLDGQQLRGKGELRSMLEFSESRWPDLWTRVVSIVASGEWVAVEMTAVATESGQRISQPMAAFYRVRDGLIVEQRSYYDLGALQRVILRSRL